MLKFENTKRKHTKSQKPKPQPQAKNSKHYKSNKIHKTNIATIKNPNHVRTP